MTRSRVRAALLASVSTPLAAAVLLVLAWAVRAPRAAAAAAGPAPVDALVALAAAALCALLTGWLMLGVALTLGCHVSHRAHARLGRLACSIAPPTVRRVVALALGASLAGLPLAPAVHAATARPTTVASVPVGGPSATPPAPVGLGPDWTADRPAAPPSTSASEPAARAPGIRQIDVGHLVTGAAARHGSGSRPDAAVVVRSGDTLWDLAAHHLAAAHPHGAGSGPVSARDIAAEWPRWYALNRHTIGPDPDRLLPGQRLLVPDRSSREESP